MIVTKLSFVAGAPCVDLAKTRFGNGVLETALDCVDSLSYITETLNKFWVFCWICVTKTQLTIRVVFTE